jgi:D-alanyl-D-alanine carboxypeptidase (penicillin-binding protein 5/6)
MAPTVQGSGGAQGPARSFSADVGPHRLVKAALADPIESAIQMTSHRYAARALALSLTLTAAGALAAMGPTQAAAAPDTSVSTPVGGRQLAAPGVIVNLKPGLPPPPAMPSRSFVLADLDTGQILVAKAPHVPHAPASTLKTLTALTLMPILDPNRKIRVKPQDVNVQGTHVGIVPGTAYSVSTLMQGMLITSGNDAAYALARGNHSVAQTLRAMNAKAAAIGAGDTVARDPSGLDAVGQTSSAYDLALISRAAMKLPDFRRYVGTRRTTLPGGKSVDGTTQPGFKIANHNMLLYNYRGAIGVKNGYTIAARYSYVEAATRGGKTYIVTEMDRNKSGWRQSAAMLDWAFAHGSSLTPVGQLVDSGHANTSRSLSAVPKPATTSPPSATATAPAPAAPTSTPSVAAGSAQPPLTASPGAFVHQPASWAWLGAAGGVSALLIGAAAWLVLRAPSRKTTLS